MSIKTINFSGIRFFVSNPKKKKKLDVPYNTKAKNFFLVGANFARVEEDEQEENAPSRFGVY
jgi:hypothetical protein